MADNGFNGSTLVFGGVTYGTTTFPIVSMSHNLTAEAVDVSGAGNSEKLYVGGQTDRELQVEVVGTPAAAVPSTGALTVTWFDGQSHAITSALCVECSESGSVNGAITSTLRFKKVS